MSIINHSAVDPPDPEAVCEHGSDVVVVVVGHIGHAGLQVVVPGGDMVVVVVHRLEQQTELWSGARLVRSVSPHLSEQAIIACSSLEPTFIEIQHGPAVVVTGGAVVPGGAGVEGQPQLTRDGGDGCRLA